MNINYRQIILILLLSFIFSTASLAQKEESNLQPTFPTEFTYQGKLNAGGSVAGGNYDFEFKLVDASGNVLDTQQRLNVAVSNGIFTVKLDFGAQPFVNGDSRFLEIGVRPVGSAAFTQLAPRQPITASPYAISSALALFAQNSNQATNSQQLAGIAANQYVLTNDSRLSDDRNPLAGSNNYIQNTTSQQIANFTINGVGTAAILKAFTVDSTFQYSLGGGKFITAPGTNNTFLGISSAANWTTGANNSFFGKNSGQQTSTGSQNSFFGANAGMNNTVGAANSFFGADSGMNTSNGNDNSFFGYQAGLANTTGGQNSFFGSLSGASNTTGLFNSFFGASAGRLNITGGDNAFFGTGAGSKTDASGNAFFGAFSGYNNTTGNKNSFFGAYSGYNTTTGTENAFFGNSAGKANTTGTYNSFFGESSGAATTTGTGNSFFGASSGGSNTTGSANSFFGGSSGFKNTSGSENTFFGISAGYSNVDGNDNTSFGFQAGFSANGANNTFIGKHAGVALTVGNSNIFIGANAAAANNIGSNNIAIGVNSVVQNNVENSVVIGNSATVSQSDAIILGNSNQNTFITRRLFIGVLGNGSFNQLCRNAATGEVGPCSSSIRYKTDVRNFTSGLDLIRRLRPVSFTWKQDGTRDLGFVAEEVAAVEPLLTTTNDKGEIEGVKYDRISTALVNAVGEQQAQIERQQEQIEAQQKQIDALKKLVCAQNPNAEICAEKELEK